MTHQQSWALIIIGAALLVACNSTKKVNKPDAGSDTDTDTDSDTDSDSDTDTDTDSDTDSDSDTDTDTDSDTDSDTDTDTASHGDKDDDGGLSDSGPDGDTDTTPAHQTDTDDAGVCPDNDSDDWCAEFDCDDESSAVHPGADEVFDPPNSIDEDCDGLTDEANATGLEDWDMFLTVDNMFDVYFGTPTTTTGSRVGGGSNWKIVYHFTANGRKVTDYMYVATASDHSGAQGFLGTFTNLTRVKTTITGDPVWEVFPAGAYEATNPYWPNSWPKSQMPTQSQVDTAIAYAEANGLWVTPVSAPGYDNDPSTSIAPATSEWRTQCNPECTYDEIPKSAQWIWYDSGRGPTTSWASPIAGFNHDEFIVFRVAGAVPAVN